MTYPPDPQQPPEQPGGYPQQPSEPQGGYPPQQPEQPSGYYQQPDPNAYAHPGDGTAQYPQTGYQTPVGGSGKNFFGSLFDFSFRHFITPQVLQIYYVVGLVVLGIGVLFGLIAAIITIAEFDALFGLMQLILVPVIGFVYLLMLRMGLELVANFFRIGDDVKALREKSDRTP